MNKKKLIRLAVQTAINILAAILTALGATSCINSINTDTASTSINPDTASISINPNNITA